MTTSGANRMQLAAGAGTKTSAPGACVEVSPAHGAESRAPAIGVELTIRVGAEAARALGVTTLTPMTLDLLGVAAGGRMTIEVSMREIGRRIDPALLGLTDASSCEAQRAGPVTQIRSTGIELVFREHAGQDERPARGSLVYARLPGLAALGGGRYEISRGLARLMVELARAEDHADS